MYDASNRKDVRRAEKDDRIRSGEAGQVVVNLCSTTAGRRWVWDLLSGAGVFHTTFAESPTVAAFNEGNRNQGLKLLAQVSQFCPEQIAVMMQEDDVREHTTDARRDADTPSTSGDRVDDHSEPGVWG